jgi:hypothetical protein
VRSSKHSLLCQCPSFNFYAVVGLTIISGSRLSRGLISIFLLEFKNNFMDDFLTDIDIVHNIDNRRNRHREDNCSDNSRRELRVDGLNLREDLVAQVLALCLFIRELGLESLHIDRAGLRRCRHWSCLRSHRSFHHHRLGYSRSHWSCWHSLHSES